MYVCMDIWIHMYVWFKKASLLDIPWMDIWLHGWISFLPLNLYTINAIYEFLTTYVWFKKIPFLTSLLLSYVCYINMCKGYLLLRTCNYSIVFLFLL